MKRGLILLLTGMTLAATLAATALKAQTRSIPAQQPQRYEVAMIKWDGSDKIQLLTPQKSEYLRLFQTGVKLPRDIHEEEFCLTWAANKLAQEGWEPVTLHATRILLRRPAVR